MLMGGVLYVVTVTAISAGVLWSVLRAAGVGRAVKRAARRLGLAGPEPLVPLAVPIERIAADLRRIRPEAMGPHEGATLTRRRVIVAAYDRALLDACTALGIASELDQLGGLDQEIERLRTEYALELAGLLIN
jgi:hypothetical protein